MNKSESKESEELKSINKEIQKWYNNKSKILNVITAPYNTNKIFISIVELLIKQNKKIIYICDNYYVFNEFLRNLKNALNYNNIENYLDNISYRNFKEARYIKENYELCIIDDITSFSNVSNEEIRTLIEYMYIYSKRIIAYSIEKTISMGKKLEIEDLVNKSVFIEPRIINTRINLNEDIPEILYDYLLWFKNKNAKVIIYLPTKDKVDRIYSYFTNKLIIEDINIVKFTKNENLKDIERLYLNKDKSIFIITNNIRNFFNKYNNVNIIILFAENYIFTYKKIIYLCASVSKKDSKYNYLKEVLLVSKDTSKDMEKAKDISRRYNKKKWENGLITY